MYRIGNELYLADDVTFFGLPAVRCTWNDTALQTSRGCIKAAPFLLLLVHHCYPYSSTKMKFFSTFTILAFSAVAVSASPVDSAALEKRAGPSGEHSSSLPIVVSEHISQARSSLPLEDSAPTAVPVSNCESHCVDHGPLLIRVICAGNTPVSTATKAISPSTLTSTWLMKAMAKSTA